MHPVSSAPRGRDIQMTAALKWSFPPVCWNVCLPERPPVCALWAQLHLQFIPNFWKTLHMFRVLANLYVVWTFFIFSPYELQTDRQTCTHTHMYLVMWVPSCKDTYMQTIPSYAIYHWAMLLNIYVTLFPEINSRFFTSSVDPDQTVNEACIGVLGIQDICHFTSRDIRYFPFYFQGYGILCSIFGLLSGILIILENLLWGYWPVYKGYLPVYFKGYGIFGTPYISLVNVECRSILILVHTVCPNTYISQLSSVVCEKQRCIPACVCSSTFDII